MSEVVTEDEVQLSESKSNCGYCFMNKDLLTEILLRLPTPESINRCKLVSKDWYFLISQPDFISRFINHRTHQYSKNNNSFCEYRDISAVILSYQNPRNDQAFFVASKDPCFKSPGFTLSFLTEVVGSVSVLGSFNDLLFCRASRNDYLKYYICNPFTFEWLALPLPTIERYQGRTRFGFICEPYYARDVKGNYTINDRYRYRVVFFTDFGKDELVVYTYHSETGRWDDYFLIGTEFNCFSNVVAYDGKLNWYNGVNVVAYDPFNGGQCCFIDGSKFKPMEHTAVLSYCLGVCRGVLRMMRLASCFYGDAIDSDTLSIWELEEYGVREWNLEHKIPFNAMISKNSWVQKFLKGGMVTAKALAFNPTDMDVVYLGFNERVISCNLLNGELDLAGKVPNGSLFYNCDNVFPILLPWWHTPVTQNAHF